MGTAVIIFIMFAVFAVNILEKRVDQCSQSGGVVVKTPDGWKCVQVKELS
jgi:hypothetical protein